MPTWLISFVVKNWRILLGGLIVFAIIGGIRYYGYTEHQAGKTEVQMLWNEHEKNEKDLADKQKAEKEKIDKERADANTKLEKDLSVTRSKLDAALARLRGFETLSGGGSVSVAESRFDAMSCYPINSGKVDFRKPTRVTSCESNSGTDPCFASRRFFEEALKVSIDRGATREWVKTQGITIIEESSK